MSLAASIFPSRHSLQRYSLVLLIVFSVYLVGSVAVRSRDRRSIFTAANAYASQDVFSDIREPGGGGSKLQLKDFRRVAVKNGKPAWEIQASEAEFYSREGVTNVNNATMVMHRDNASDVSVRARSAKLHMTKDSLDRVELAGETHVEMDNSVKFRTEVALYEVDRGKIFAPGAVQIVGDGYIIDGESLQADIGEQVIQLARNVRCVFETSAKLPSSTGLPFGAVKK